MWAVAESKQQAYIQSYNCNYIGNIHDTNKTLQELPEM